MSNRPRRSPQPAPRRPAAAPPSDDRTRSLIVIAAVVAVVAILGIVVAVVVGGGDDDGDDDDGGAAVEPYRPVTVEGEPLAEFSEAVQAGDEPDPAIGAQAPVVSGTDYAGTPITIDAASDGPTLVVLLAHWCPHCNDEIPVLNEWRDSGDVPDGLDIVGVSTAVSSDAPNYPPDEWLVDVDWQWPVLADDRPPDEASDPPAFAAYGGRGFPMMVLIGDDGTVLGRLSGEISADDLTTWLENLL
jgi:cytochrome c biogenesis protein CcmG/thiol:disulfide interchange protein DsbE